MNITYKNKEKLWAAILGACMFNAIFWQEKMGINTVFYDVFIVGSVLILYPEAKTNKAVQWLLLMQSICLTMVVVQNTLLSKIAFTLVLLTFTAFAEYAHRSIFLQAVLSCSIPYLFGRPCLSTGNFFFPCQTEPCPSATAPDICLTHLTNWRCRKETEANITTKNSSACCFKKKRIFWPGRRTTVGFPGTGLMVT